MEGYIPLCIEFKNREILFSFKRNKRFLLNKYQEVYACLQLPPYGDEMVYCKQILKKRVLQFMCILAKKTLKGKHSSKFLHILCRFSPNLDLSFV